MAAGECHERKQAVREGHVQTFWTRFHVVPIDRPERNIVVGRVSTVYGQRTADLRKSESVEKYYHRSIHTKR